MDSKEKVISTLRALLISNGRKDATPLRELEHDYCAYEDTNEIPHFEHKSVIDFLISSAEFIVNVEPNGLITVREKPTSLSSHLKALITQQKSCTNESLNALNAQEEVTVESNQKDSAETRDNLGDHMASQNIFGKLGQSSRYIEPTAPIITDISTVDPYKDSFSKVNNMCVNFRKTLTCDAQNKYRSVLQIDSVKYSGDGKSSDEANENAARKYLYSIDTGEHQSRAQCLEYSNKIVPNSSIMKLCEKYEEITIRTTVRRGERNVFKTIIEVDSVNYYGHGKSFQNAAANAADACLLSIKQALHNKLISKVK